MRKTIVLSKKTTGPRPKKTPRALGFGGAQPSPSGTPRVTPRAATQIDSMVDTMEKFKPSSEFDKAQLVVVDRMFNQLNSDQVRRCSKAAVVLYEWLSIVIKMLHAMDT